MTRLQPKIVVVRGPGGLGPFVLSPEATSVTIGRREDNEIRLPDEEVAPRHCRLSCPEGRWCVEDLGGPDGTFCNGARVTGRHEITDMDTLTVGPFSLQFLLEPVDEGGPPAAIPAAGDSPGR